MRSILCKMFGHKVPRDGYYKNRPYFNRGSWRVIDGIGRIHQCLVAECVRCEKVFEFGMIHDYPKPNTDE